MWLLNLFVSRGQVTDICYQSVSVCVTLVCFCVCLSVGLFAYVQVADQNQFNIFATLSLDEVRFCLKFHICCDGCK